MTPDVPEPQVTSAEALQSRLERIAAGEPVAAAVRGLPREVADEVRLGAALAADWPARMAPGARAALQARLQDELAGETRRARRSGVWAWLPALGAAVIVLALALGTTMVASAEALPGDTLYGVKRATEEARLILTVDPHARALAHIELLEVRLDEIRMLVNRGLPIPAAVIERFLEAHRKVWAEAGKLGDADLTRTAREVSEAQARELLALAAVSSNADVLRAGAAGLGADTAAPSRPEARPVAPPAQRPVRVPAADPTRAAFPAIGPTPALRATAPLAGAGIAAGTATPATAPPAAGLPTLPGGTSGAPPTEAPAQATQAPPAQTEPVVNPAATERSRIATASPRPPNPSSGSSGGSPPAPTTDASGEEPPTPPPAPPGGPSHP